MRTHSVIPNEVRSRQRLVSDPATSAWVTANAGAGKTYVLAQRVINLLLDGVAPEKILCITFTKAAAANMAKRVFDTLAKWTTLDDAGLDAAILECAGAKPSAVKRAVARRLFARALETPGGLKVQTIHAFCTLMLHQFPFEANVAARFEVLDDAHQNQLLEQTTLDVLLEGAGQAESELGRALAAAMTAAADVTFREVVREAIGRRDNILRWLTDAGGLPEALAALSRSLGVGSSDNLAAVEAEFFSGAVVLQSQWPRFVKALSEGTKQDHTQADRFAALKTLSGAARLDAYVDIFCIGDRSPRKSLVTKPVAQAHPAFAEQLRREQERVCALLERRRAVVCRDRSAALVVVAHEVLSRYAAAKQRRGLLDYDDLIEKTRELLTNIDAKWVHYKLDLGIDHVLIDEAQDTSKKQWEIINELTDEFTAGAGAHSGVRTTFAVGDEKQSIYSFQQAAPEEFAEMRRIYERRHNDAGLEFRSVRFEHSFRSGDSVLGAVDAVFKDISQSVTSDSDGFPPHIALPGVAAGVVELWELERPDDQRPIEGWEAPFDTVSETSSRVKLARRIAAKIGRLIASGEAKPGDVLILVRSRGELFEAIIRALKHAEIAVAGADRLVLTEHIAVMDLMVLADALLLPQDDLALATALRSPLFAFTDQDLYDIAWNRAPRSLRASLNDKASERPLFAEAAARLDALSLAARRETPFAFYAGILGAGGGRRKIWSRLGPEANDALDEFLNLALDYERRETPSLQGFLTWLREAQTEIKRDMEISRDEVRVMTVHGAKGLEAPTVILADTTARPTGPKPPRLLTLGGAMIWAAAKSEDVPAVADARAAQERETENEYRRLLYVAMTRAEDRLIVCGAKGKTNPPDGCWYDLLERFLKAQMTEEDDNGERVWRYRKAETGTAAPAIVAGENPAGLEKHEFPPWLKQPAPPEAPRTVVLSPSSAFGEGDEQDAPSAGTAADREKALQRGRIVHRLMQSLPDIPVEHRKAALERYLGNSATDFSGAEQTEIARQVFAVLGEPNFAEVFAPGGRAEVPIVGRIAGMDGKPVAISGQVDRLIVTQDAVLIADYKTDRLVPERIEDAPAHYVGQLALYRAVLMKLYPQKTVRAALIFTSGPRLVEIPVPAMESALDEVLTKARHAPVKVS
jgi:ATP-dependent helicase/nuclease subunit A